MTSVVPNITCMFLRRFLTTTFSKKHSKQSVLPSAQFRKMSAKTIAVLDEAELKDGQM